MKHEADIIDRVFEYGRQRANLEAIRNRLQEEVRTLRGEKRILATETQDALDTVRFLETKNEEMVREQSKLKTEVVDVLRQHRILKAANDEMVSIISNKENKALAALKVIASGGASKIGMKRYASETLQKIRKGE